jgi:hypothetical protein
MHHLTKFFIRPAFLMSCAIPCLLAQSSAPKAYTLTQVTQLTEASMFTGQASNLKVYRSGSKELVELTIAPWPGNPKGVHTRTLFDFQAHKTYTQDLDGNTCSWMSYVSARAPVWYDPVTALDDATRAEMAKSKPRRVGTETVNGFAAVITEADTPDGKIRTWTAQNGDFPVKMTLQPKSGPLTAMMEVQQVDFNAPAASLFVAPGNCSTHAQGEWSDTRLSAHAEAQVDAQASASTDLATGKTQSQATAKSNPAALPRGGAAPAAAAAADSKSADLVENVDLEPSKNACTVLFRVVQAGTMEPIVTGLEVRVDRRNLSAQYQNGMIRIPNPPPQFDLQVNRNGGGWANTINKQCYRPETVLLLVIPQEPLGDIHWLWVKSGKYAAVQK